MRYIEGALQIPLQQPDFFILFLPHSSITFYKPIHQIRDYTAMLELILAQWSSKVDWRFIFTCCFGSPVLCLCRRSNLGYCRESWDSSFQQSLFDYLCQCHSGDYINATHAEVSENVNTRQGLPGYVKPTDLLPVAPPRPCSTTCSSDTCHPCHAYILWHCQFVETITDILFRVNYHVCHKTVCMNNKRGTCRSHFPWETYPRTMVKPEIGHVFVEKRWKAAKLLVFAY